MLNHAVDLCFGLKPSQSNDATVPKRWNPAIEDCSPFAFSSVRNGRATSPIAFYRLIGLDFYADIRCCREKQCDRKEGRGFWQETCPREEHDRLNRVALIFKNRRNPQRRSEAPPFVRSGIRSGLVIFNAFFQV